MGRKMRRIVNILRCNSQDRSKDENSDNEEPEGRSKSVDELKERKRVTIKQIANLTAQLEESLEMLEEKMERHNEVITSALMSHCLSAKGKPPHVDGLVPIHDIEKRKPTRLKELATAGNLGAKSTKFNNTEKTSPLALKEISKKMLVSMVYQRLRSEQDARTRRRTPSRRACNTDVISGQDRHQDYPESGDGFVFGTNAKILDMFSRNNNRPINDEDIDTNQSVKIKFSKRSASQDSQRSSSSLDPSIPRNSRIGKDYYLFPIGSFTTSSPTTKWKDVASVIPTGVKHHRNIDPRKYMRYEKPLTTISQGLPTSSYTKDRVYAVRRIRPPVTCMEILLDQNTSTRIFQETHAKFLCVNLLMALRFLHEHDIAHGSICPRKIILNEKGYPCLTGFETAEVIHDRPSRPKPKINVEYSAPEQIYQDCISETTDIYSLGVLTYHMIYGRPPHRGKTDVATRHNALNKDFEARFKPEPISKEGRKFISKCIRKYDNRRFNILHQKSGLLESVSWFSGLSEEKLYKQSVPSPLLALVTHA